MTPRTPLMQSAGGGAEPPPSNPSSPESPSPHSIEALSILIAQLVEDRDIDRQRMRDLEAEVGELRGIQGELQAIRTQLPTLHSEGTTSNPASSHFVVDTAAQMEEFRKQIVALHDDLADTQRELAGALQTIEALHTAPRATTNPDLARDPRFPDVPTFDGSGNYRTWRTAIKGFFAAQPNTFSDPRVRAYCIGARLTGSAAAHYNLWAQSPNPDGGQAEVELQRRLDLAFDDPNRVTNARASLSLLKQGEAEDTRAYVLKFTTFLHDAAYASEDTARDLFVNSLQPRIRQEVRRELNRTPSSAPDMVTLGHLATSTADMFANEDRLRQVERNRFTRVGHFMSSGNASGGNSEAYKQSRPGGAVEPESPCHLVGHFGHKNKECYAQHPELAPPRKTAGGGSARPLSRPVATVNPAEGLQSAGNV